MNKSTQQTKKIVRMAIFLSIGIILNIVESMIPLPIAIPGVRLGLANTMGLIVLYFYTPKDYALLGFLRVLLVGLLRTGIGSVAFLLSLSGWFLSTLVSLLLYLFHRASIYGLSICSAMFHGVGQIIMIIILYSLPSMINYLPVLLITGVIGGILTAFISAMALKKLDKLMI